MTLTLKLLGVFLPRTGLQCYVSRRVVIKCIVPCLTVSYITLLEYSCTAEHPADRASRAHEDVGDQSAGQSRGVISMNSWNDYEAATKIEAINYVSRVLYYHLQLKGKVPVSARLLEAWSLLAALAGDAVGLHDRRLAISLLLEFHSMLRTGNLLKFRKIGFLLHKAELPRHRCAARNKICATYHLQ